MKKIAIKTINDKVNNSADNFMNCSEDFYNRQILEVTEHLANCSKDRPIILLSGPSGSGKTTSAHRIEAMLREMGHPTHTISMDNYFLSAEDNLEAMDENGNIDYESPLRLDIPLFTKHLEMLANCEEIHVPTFDFIHQQRREGFNLKRKPGEFVILEGIHALNPMVTGKNLDFATCIYVSVRTRIMKDDGQLLHPSKIRLMRRLIRDKIFRGRAFEETLDFFKWVQRGENLYIMPHKERADFDIDTFLPYEASVYKSILLPELEKIRSSYESYSKFSEIECFLREILPVDGGIVPNNSLLREFTGG